jgi:hypothetical protein
MIDEIPTDERITDMQKGQVHICAPLVADSQTAIAIKPRQRSRALSCSISDLNKAHNQFSILFNGWMLIADK